MVDVSGVLIPAVSGSFNRACMVAQRGVAEFSISLATGRADIYTETPVKVSGFKRVIDEQDWTITKVTHFLNNSGFTTSLELEVRLSDVEYETEDDE